MLLNNLESLPYNQVRESYPNVDISEIKNKDGNMDLFLTYLLNNNIPEIKNLIKDYEFKCNLDKSIKLSEILDLGFFRYETKVSKDKDLFPPLSKKINSIQYIIFISYYINNYTVDNEVDFLDNNKNLKKVLFLLLDNNRDILKLKDESGHTVGDYLLLFLNPLSLEIFEKYDSGFESIEKTSKKYIENLINIIEKFDYNNTNNESVKEINKIFHTTINQDMFLSHITQESLKKLSRFGNCLSAYIEKGKMEKSIIKIKSNKKDELIKF